MKPSWNFARVGLGDEMDVCSQTCGCAGQPPTLGCQARPSPSACCSAVTAIPRWTLPHLALTTRAWTDYITSPPTRVKTFVKCRKFAKTYITAMSRDASDESAKNAGIRLTSTGTRVKQGDLVLVKKADSALYNDCVHVKLTHDRWTGPRTVTAVMTPGMCYRVTLQGRRERVRRAAACHSKPYHLRRSSLRHDFGDEYAHFAWGLVLGLVTDSTLASPLYTLVDRCTIQLPNGSWEWRYRGRYLNGSLSGFITESECLDSFSPMQLDVFHVLWELYQPPRHRPRPAAKPSSNERLVADRAHALLKVPIGTVVCRDFTDQQGRIQRCRTEVYDYETPYWRVRYADGDWEELTQTEIEQERDTSSASTELTSNVSK